MRIVADTNTLISGLLWQGAPRRLMDAAQAGIVQLVTTPALIAELTRVLERAKFANRLQRAGISAEELLATYTELAQIVTPADIPPTVPTDPDDDAVLAAALGGDAAIIVSGDRDLLDLGRFHHIPVLTVVQMLAVIE